MEHPLPDPDQEANLYDDEFYVERRLERGLDEQDVVMRGLIEERVRLLTRLNAAPGSLLDLGAGTGLFVEAATRAGWRAVGIETSAAAVRIAGTITKAPVLHQRLDDVSFEQPFDAVTLWDVLEHMPDPRAALRRVSGLVREQGMVAISLPNVAGLKARMLGRRWRYYRREFGHLSHFSPTTLVTLLEQAGFTSALVQTGGFFNLGKPFRRDPAAVRTSRVLGRLQSVANAAAGGLSLGEDLLVVGRL
jgi:SAM-dependent methyltransferase